MQHSREGSYSVLPLPQTPEITAPTPEWWLRGPLPRPSPPRPGRTLIYQRDSQAPKHYLLGVQINEASHPAIVDTGAAFSLISSGLVRRLGLSPVPSKPKSLVGVEGSGQTISKELQHPTITLGDQLTVQISSLAVTDSEVPLLLLGNDILNAHDQISFEGISNNSHGDSCLEFRVRPEQGHVVRINCLDGPLRGF